MLIHVLAGSLTLTFAGTYAARAFPFDVAVIGIAMLVQIMGIVGAATDSSVLLKISHVGIVTGIAFMPFLVSSKPGLLFVLVMLLYLVSSRHIIDALGKEPCAFYNGHEDFERDYGGTPMAKFMKMDVWKLCGGWLNFVIGITLLTATIRLFFIVSKRS